MIATLTPMPTSMPHQSKPLPKFAPLVTADGRRAGWCWGDKPRCTNPEPHAHRLRTKIHILSEAIVECENRHDRGGPTCGVRLYVRKVPRLTKSEALCWFVCEVTPEHVERMKREPMLFLETMTILGCVLPGVELDIPTPESDE